MMTSNRAEADENILCQRPEGDINDSTENPLFVVGEAINAVSYGGPYTGVCILAPVILPDYKDPLFT